jgi:hypothetical protein
MRRPLVDCRAGHAAAAVGVTAYLRMDIIYSAYPSSRALLQPILMLV